MKWLLEWLAGYSRAELEGAACFRRDRNGTAVDEGVEPQNECDSVSRSILRKIGTTLLFVAVIEAITWGWGFSSWGDGDPLRQAGFIAFGAAVGFSVSLVIDRPAVYALDTRGPGFKRIWPFITLRILMILIFGTVSVGVAAFTLFSSDRESHAFHKREQLQSDRVKRVTAEAGLGEKKQDLRAARLDLSKAEAEARVTPPPIVEEVRKGSACWSRYRVLQRQTAQAAGGRFPGTARRLSAVRSECGRLTTVARKHLAEHESEQRSKVAAARDEENRSKNVLRTASADTAADIARGKLFDESHVTANSISNFVELLEANPGTMTFVIVALVMYLAIITMPFSVKPVLGQTSFGRRIGVARAIEFRMANDEWSAFESASDAERAMRASLAEAAVLGVQSEEFQTRAAAQILDLAAVVSPYEAVDQILTVLAQRQARAEAMAKRYPAMRPLIAKILAEAMRRGTLHMEEMRQRKEART